MTDNARRPAKYKIFGGFLYKNYGKFLKKMI